MEKLYKYYRENIAKYGAEVDRRSRWIHLMGSVRLALVAGALLMLWINRDGSWQLIMGVTMLFVVPFAMLMWYHNRIYSKKLYLERLRRLNMDELKGLDYDFNAFDGAADRITADHPFALDLDLFGERSLFQSINRTVTGVGRERLADWFAYPLVDRVAIEGRQEAVRELADADILRQRFNATGSSIEDSKEGVDSDMSFVEKMLSGNRYFSGCMFWRLMVWIIPFAWLFLALLNLMGFVGYTPFNMLFIFTLMVAYSRSKQLNQLYDRMNRMEVLLKRYSKLFAIVEGAEFKSAELREISSNLRCGDEMASSAIGRLSGYIGGLDQRFSLAGIIFNLLYLRDIRHALLLEGWLDMYAGRMEIWFDSVARFDALCSLGGFAFNHPGYCFPEIAENYFTMEGRGLGHPLLDRRVCVTNDISLPEAPWFLIITGANMAGKSTYLRTVGVNYLLACVGAPVFASSFRIFPAPLVTSLRTSDSLASNESYFFAELKRLKMIIDRLRGGERLFIILDEILKGTNSIDKQKGSLALMRQLISYEACGIIATHDLILGGLEEEFPGKVKNFRFEADIKNDELSFSYMLREGIAQNMNACFLMRKMGITF